jgi:opacity protein-like surface antigen
LAALDAVFEEMRMISRKTLLATVAVAAATLAAAPSALAGNWYVNVAGGANWLGDNSFAASGSTTSQYSTLDFGNDPNIGFVISAAVGMNLNNLLPGLRVEGELAYRENDVNAQWVSSVTTTTTAGSLETNSGSPVYQHSAFSIMANAWYDFQIGSLRPYVGGGLGWAETEVDGVYESKARPNTFSESGFAWQLGAGIHLPIDERHTLGIGYRYFSGPDVTIPAESEANLLSGSVDTESHAVTVGLTVGL